MSMFLSIAALSYLLGSVPFGYILVKLFAGEDIRQKGSGNIGATNVSRISPALGALTLMLDAAKGTTAVVIAYLLSDRTHPGRAGHAAYEEMALAAFCVVAGHMFPLWLKFQGGKGVATGLGAFAVIAPKSILIAAVIFLITVFLSRFVSLGSISAVAFFPFLVLIFRECGRDYLALALIFMASILIVVRHHENIRRLLTHTEHRFGAKSV